MPGFERHSADIAVLQSEVKNIHEKLDDQSENIKSIAGDVGAMRLMMAQHQGASKAIQYTINLCAGLGGAFLGAVGFGKH